MPLLRFFKTLTKAYVEVSTDNPLPVSMEGSTVNVNVGGVSIQDPTTPANKQKINADGSINTVITGSAVEQVSVYAALDIRDTVEIVLPKLDLTKYRMVNFYVKHSLNQPLIVSPRVADPAGARAILNVWDGAAWIDLSTSIPSGVRARLLNSAFPEMNTSFRELTLSLKCDIAPVSGNVILWYEGFLR